MFSYSKQNFALPDPANGGFEFLLFNAAAAKDLKQSFKEAMKETLVNLKRLLVKTT